MPTLFAFNDWADLILFSAGFTLVLLLFVKYFGWPGRIRLLRRAMVGDLYALLLYRRSPRALVQFEALLVWRNIKLLVLLAPTLIVGSVMFALLYDALADRYGTRPLQPRQPIVVKSRLMGEGTWSTQDATLMPMDPALQVNARVRSAPQKTVWTRLEADHPGSFAVAVNTDRSASAVINVGLDSLPTRPIQRVDGREVEVRYPPRRWWGSESGWIWCFLVASLFTAVPLAQLIRLRI